MPSDAEQYERIVRAYDQRYQPRVASAEPWQNPGDVRQVERYQRGVRLDCENGWLELHWISPDCLRVRLMAGGDDETSPFSYNTTKTDWPVVEYEVQEGSNALVMQSAALRCRIGRRPFRMGLEMLDERIVYIDAAGPKWRSDGAVRLSKRLHPEESGYGLGAHTHRLNLRGKRVDLMASGQHPDTHVPVPFYLGVQRGAGCGILWDNLSYTVVDIGVNQADELVFEAETGPLVYYIMAADSIMQVVARLTELTGRIDLPPMWALGYQQSRTSYYPQARVLEIAQKFREHEIPCDVIHLDHHHMANGRVFSWDVSRFPDPAVLLSDLHEMGFKVVTTLHSGIAIDSEYEAYKSGFFRDVFLKYPDGKTVAIPGADGMAHLPDFSKPAARDWWRVQCERWLSQGVDGLVNAGQPSVSTGGKDVRGLPGYVLRDKEGLGGKQRELHNADGLLLARASYEALRKSRPDQRAFNLSHAGTSGSQRYGMIWTAETDADWKDLRQSISICLNLNLAGVSLVGADIGGYHQDADAELFTRWLQAACLLPLFRANTAQNTRSQEPWAFGQPYEVINRMTIQLRYRLLPYLYAVIAQSREYGWPVIRPVFLAEPDNPELRGIDDCYLVGDSLLVAPVLKSGSTQRSVYLPRGTWYDYWTGEPLDGGMTVVTTAPLERLPLFVRAGTVLPLWPEMQYVGEKPVERLTLRVYPGAGETVLYEDAGEGMAYLDGAYRWVYFTCDWQDDTLTLDRRVAGRYEPPYSGIRLEIVGFDEEPAEVRVDRKGAPLWYYDDELLELSLSDFRRVEVVRKSQDADRTLPHKDQ